MMQELEFTKKPRRMTSPPQNQRKWLAGYEGVQVILEVEPRRMAYFAREATWGDIMREPTHAEVIDTLKEVQGGKVLGAAFKGGFGFRIRGSRSCMDQMLRLAEGSGGAGSGAGAQTTRDNDQRDFNIIVPNTIHNLYYGHNLEMEEGVAKDSIEEAAARNELYHRVVAHTEAARKLYGDLVDAGVPPQDARYVALPLGFQTQWFHVMSLGNMIKLCEQRLCNGLTQHETNYLVRIMRDLVVERHPWMVDNLRSGCEKRGECVSQSMLFPPCGAFVDAIVQRVEEVSVQVGGELSEEEFYSACERERLSITKYNPEKHLYRAEQNDAMQFAQWDIERQRLQKKEPDKIFSMSQPPKKIGFRITSPK